jgi:hypothetical protein
VGRWKGRRLWRVLGRINATIDANYLLLLMFILPSIYHVYKQNLARFGRT